MTVSQALTTIRNLLNESSAGFYTDAQIYDFLSRGQDDVINILLQRWRATDNTLVGYFPDTLTPLITSGTVSTTTANYVSLSTLTGLMESFAAELYNAGDGAVLKMTRTTYPKLLFSRANTYAGHSYTTATKSGQVFYARYGANLLTSFADASFPNTDFATIRVYYWVAPTQISGSQEFQTLADCHPAIVKLALFYAFTQDGQSQKASAYLQEGLKMVMGL